MNDSSAERAKAIRQVQDAVARGQAALVSGDKIEATRWLDRAHRLAPADGTITLVLASAAIGDDNPRAAALFAEVLASSDVRDAWFGLATARLLMGDLTGAHHAAAQMLSRHKIRTGISALADQVARATGAAGWCGVSGEGVLVVHPLARRAVEIRIDGKTFDPPSRYADPTASSSDGKVGGWETKLPMAWRRARSITVTVASADVHLIGSPISLSAIGRVEGRVVSRKSGIRGWAWCPGDPDSEPRLTVGTGRSRKEIVAAGSSKAPIPGLAPLARARSFAVSWSDLPDADVPIRVRGQDGRDFVGSPVIRNRPGEVRSAPVAGSGGSLAVPAATRGRLDMARWRANTTEAVVLVTHDDGGGVERRVVASIAAHEAQGRRAIVLRPVKSRNGRAGVTVASGTLPALRFALPRERSILIDLLRGASPVTLELHHFLNHDPSLFEIIRTLDVPYDVHIHDYAWFCPRIALVGRGDRYCGEPPPAACETCVRKAGSYLQEDIRVPALLERTRGVLSRARRIIAPSDDTASRMVRHFPGISPIVMPHDDDSDMAEPPSIPHVTGTVRVCVGGAIGLHKGFDVVLACARDAKKRGLDLTFLIAGTTTDDQRLIDTGRVFVTGPYQPDEAVALIRAQRAALALLPSIWPETWCLGLTELWRAGLRVAAFDIGAPAERIRRTGRGFLLPLGSSPMAINDALLNAAKGTSLLPIRRSSAYKPFH